MIIIGEYKFTSKNGDFIIIKDPTFADFIELEDQINNQDIDDLLIEKYFVKSSSKPFSEFNNSEKDTIYEFVGKLLKGDELTDNDLLYITMAIYYRTTPDHIKSLPCHYGIFLLKGMNIANRMTSKPKKEPMFDMETFDPSKFKVNPEKVNEILKQFGVV